MSTSSILFLDLETQNYEFFGKKASPYCPDNYIVLSGTRVDRVNAQGTTEVGERKRVRYESREEFELAPITDWLPIPDDCWLIVAHNSAYEISWFLQFARSYFEAFIKRGGRVYCTMHGEYLVTNQQSTYASLNETAVKYGGTHKVDGVKILWEQGVLTADIDPALLDEYLIGDSGDIENTAITFYGQLAELAAQGKTALVWERMDYVLSFAYCEWFGMYVNMPIAQANLAEQEAQIAELKDSLVNYFPTMPDDFTFNFNSLQHMSAWVYGGTVKYKGKVSYDPIKYETVDAYKLRGTDELIPIEEFNKSEYTIDDIVTYIRGKQTGLPKIFKRETNKELKKWGDKFFRFLGHINVDALPKELKSKYGARGEFRTAFNLADDVPVYSTGGDAMTALAIHTNAPFAKVITKLAALEKDTGTYYIRQEYNADGSVKKTTGMLQYVQPVSADGSGIIHHQLNTCSTVTGRPSASNPNLQTLPRGGENSVFQSKVKSMFTSRFGAQGKIIEVDYSAVEVVMSCVLTGDTKLLELLQKGTDMHCYRLAFRAFKLAELMRVPEPTKEQLQSIAEYLQGYKDFINELPPEVLDSTDSIYPYMYDACHNKEYPANGFWKNERSLIKPPSFAAQYGATAEGIAFATGLPLGSCVEFLENEALMFPTSNAFKDIVYDEVVRTSNEAGSLQREQSNDGRWRVYKTGYYTAPTGMRYQFRQQSQWDKNTRSYKMDFKRTELANYWCQGEAFFLMTVAFGQLVRHFINKNWYNNQVCLITNVHDAAYLDAANEEVAVQAAIDTKYILEHARDRVLQLWPNYGILNQVQFPAAAEMGSSMAEKIHVA